LRSISGLGNELNAGPFEKMGDQIPEELRGRRISKEYWEVAAGLVQLG